jgi:glutamate synthase domain-containing protein 1
MMKNVPTTKDISGCSIAGIMSENGTLMSGDLVMRSIATMRERANGLGGGFAAYGIYPEHRSHYALHIMYDHCAAKEAAEEAVSERCVVHDYEPIPIRPLDAIKYRPLLYRYFVGLKQEQLQRNYDKTEDDLIVELVMMVNARVEGAFIFSSGRNMGVFKGVGYPEEIGDFFRLDEYKAHIWTAHGRFPTNTTGWWGGAHPFGLLDWSVVHNGEISSYGINRRYLENFGYHCAFQTDTEVITYMFDLLVRKHGLSFETACMVMAPPFWSQINRMGPEEARLARTIRTVYGGALLNGPFSVLVGHSGGMIGFNDRIKLRPMVAARKGDLLFIASEEAAVRVVCRDPDRLWHARGGVPIMGRTKEAISHQLSGIS